MKHDIANPSLAPQGLKRIAWAERHMDVLRLVAKEFRSTKPFRGLRLSLCLHVTTETANLVRTLKAGGADIMLCASNPLSTQDDVAAALVRYDHIPVFAVRGENRSRYYRHLNTVLDHRPHVTMDDGADLVTLLHGPRKSLIPGMIGSLEETTTGVIRLKSMEQHGVLRLPVIAVNNAQTKHFFDNHYGTGQSTMDGILRATNILFAGKTVVIAGYGWCGRGCARRASGLGAKVVVTEVDPVRALQASHDGFSVMPMADAAAIGDIFVTVTGDRDVLRPEHFRRMKDNAIIANAGHFDIEIDVKGLRRIARAVRNIRPEVDEYEIGKNRRVLLLSQGRLVNLSAAEGHPASVMDMSFANQALGAVYLVRRRRQLEHRVYDIPQEIDRRIAELKLRALGIRIDRLTIAQKQYLAAWQVGT